MWTKTLIIIGTFGLICLACLIVGVCWAGYRKGKKQEIKDLNWVFLVIGGILLPVSILVLLCTTYTNAIRQRLNEPITSEMQLYGYKVLDKRHTKEKPSADAPEECKYFIDIWDMLPTYCGTFLDVKVSEEIYEKVKIGKCYLPESEPNEPTPQEPNEPVSQKAETNVSAFLFQN